NIPPKNMISVIRKTHMPIMEASFCCSGVAKWCCSVESCVTTAGGLSLNGGLLQFVVVIGFPGHDGCFVEVIRGGRRFNRPFQSRRSPWIGGCGFPVPHGPQQVDHRQQIANRQHGCTGCRQHVQHLEFGRILPVPPRHAEVSQNKLGEEGEVEPYKDDECCQLAPSFGIHATGYFRPPEMYSGQIRDHHASHHNVVKMGDDEVSVGDVHVNAERCQEQSGQATHRKKTDETESVEHWRGVRDGTLVH